MNRLVKYSDKPFKVNGGMTRAELNQQVTWCEVSILLSLGFSNKHIMRTVGVPERFIQKVVRETGLYRKNYRDGVSPIARWVTDRASGTAQKYVAPKLPRFTPALVKA
jgi:hypothetical protein